MNNYQNGGWYDNPATGKNQRWLNGAWVGGAESAGTSGGLAAYDQAYASISGEVNKYVDELVKQAQGDYDFAAKWIENNYKLALGTDDASKAAFLKKVANGLEEKVGRIAFDYDTGSYRVNQDADLTQTRTIRNRDLALSRLAEDEKVYRKGFEEDASQAREEQGASLNERGILSSTRDQATGLAGKEVGKLEGTINDTLSAYERQLSRDKTDITTSASDTLFDTNISRNRNLDDLTTTARRGAVDEQNQRDYGIQTAQRQLEQKKLAAEAERRKNLNQAKTYADYVARGATNTY